MDITSEHICKAILFTWAETKGKSQDNNENWNDILTNLLGMWKLVRHTSCDFGVLDDIDFLMDIAMERREMVVIESQEMPPIHNINKGFYNHA